MKAPDAFDLVLISTQYGHSRMLEQLQLMQWTSAHFGQEMHRDKKPQAKRQ
jgi:hypothetical protein